MKINSCLPKIVNKAKTNIAVKKKSKIHIIKQRLRKRNGQNSNKFGDKISNERFHSLKNQQLTTIDVRKR